MNVRERDDDILTTVLCKLTNLFYEFRQGCQLPGFSLKPQIFYYTTADFSATFLYICSRPILFCTSHHNTTSSKHPRIHEWIFLTLLQKILWPQTKTGKVPPPSWLLLCLGKPMACGNAYVTHFAKFPNLFEAQCWQPCNCCRTKENSLYCVIWLIKVDHKNVYCIFNV